MTKQFTLGKEERLKSSKAIEQLFKEGRKFTVAPFRVFYATTKITGLKFGVGVSTKNFKKAVDRNKVKRLTREAYRLQKNELQQLLKQKSAGLDLFFIYTDKEIPGYELVYNKVSVILKKLLNTINENNTPGS